MDNKINTDLITFRSITDADLEFLYRVYASTRNEEMAVTGWNEADIENFLRMQFNLQHTYYRQTYPQAAFDIILIDGIPAGRLYIDRQQDKMVVIDIALLPEFRRRGAGGRIMRNLVEEVDKEGLLMSLHVECNNPVRLFYKTLGLVEKGTYGVYYYMERSRPEV
ncbi:GNAT family N-acetyltransferase [Sporomusa sp. KB1]|uniref:GNAT family N-acetyltransferase n=1 Tax=Sporomusa sp. KB1 TaxID=943346 RepID=UPI0011ACC7DA|nr:GNAT family N-acetyltransferase [Sporomusa sp. KB1]TWH48797.1 ribosomal protein S18 acetylase RimI-like enzyme [Sporomusa sp. KB1]